MNYLKSNFLRKLWYDMIYDYDMMKVSFPIWKHFLEHHQESQPATCLVIKLLEVKDLQKV